MSFGSRRTWRKWPYQREGLGDLACHNKGFHEAEMLSRYLVSTTGVTLQGLEK